MNYDVFEKENCRKREGETGQEQMERVIRGAFSQKAESGEKINDMMEAAFQGCSAEEKTVVLEFQVQEWMLNPSGVLHGGIFTTAVDMTMGILARFYRQAEVVVTTQLSLNFMRCVEKESKFRVCAEAKKVGKRVIFMYAEVTDTTGGKVFGNATASFM